MTHGLAEPHPWTANRWWALIVIVFATQLGLILWLGRPQRIVSIPNDLAPALQLAGPAASNALVLSDPTLFVLPHREGFSGQAWLSIPDEDLHSLERPEPPQNWLTLARDELGANFKEFAATNEQSDLPAFTQPELQLKQPDVSGAALFPTQSVLRLVGALAHRRLIVSPPLRAWPSAEILTNSIVQLWVGADGKPGSAVLLKAPGSGGPNEADLYALRETRKARFEPLTNVDPTNPLAGLTWGQFVFEWYTLPLPATNNPVETTLPK